MPFIASRPYLTHTDHLLASHLRSPLHGARRYYFASAGAQHPSWHPDRRHLPRLGGTINRISPIANEHPTTGLSYRISTVGLPSSALSLQWCTSPPLPSSTKNMALCRTPHMAFRPSMGNWQYYLHKQELALAVHHFVSFFFHVF